MKGRTFRTLAEARKVQRALNIAGGFPKRGRNVGRGPHVVIPDEYSPGAPGWTAEAVAVLDKGDGSEFAIRDDETTRRYEGRDLDDGEGGFIRLEPGDLVDLKEYGDGARKA